MKTKKLFKSWQQAADGSKTVSSSYRCLESSMVGHRHYRFAGSPYFSMESLNALDYLLMMFFFFFFLFERFRNHRKHTC